LSAADPRPKIQFPGDMPMDFREKAFRVIEDVLRTDPVLIEVVKTWKSREGFDTDLNMPAYDMMPLVNLSPVPNPNAIWGVDETRVNFGVLVQVFVPGTCSADILGLWWAIENAIQDDRQYRGMRLRDYLCSVLKLPDGSTRTIANLRPLAPAFLPVDLTRPNGDPSYQTGSGSLVCFFSRPK
jgi:hypothetical protein